MSAANVDDTERRPGDRDAAPPADRARPIETHGTTIVEEAWLGRIAAADALFVTDERQRIQTWSSAAQRVLGYTPEEVVGRPCYRVMMGRETDGHPVCGPNCAVTRNARRGRGTASYEVTAQARDGSSRCLSNSVLVLEQRRGTFRIIHIVREQRPSAYPAATRGRRPDSPSRESPLVESLTRRELEVLRLTAQGSSVDEIAEALTISTFTARNHGASVQRKLGAHNRLEMVLLAMRRGLV